MIQIPKNVMQIGEINPHTKIYMEDYVHTFLERRKTSEVYLAFGKKEEQNGVLYYMIYGVEKKTDWDRGSLPYFRKYDRLGTIQGPAGARTLKPVRADSILLDGYFIFYEQNEDMQAYMIAVRETEEIRGSEEKEAVMEAVQNRRQMRRREKEGLTAEQEKEPASEETGGEAAAKDAKKTRTFSYGHFRQALRQSVSPFSEKAGKGRKKQRREKAGWSIPDLCRVGSLFLLLILVMLGLTSLNRYPDMKAVTALFTDAAGALWGGAQGRETAQKQEALTVEEAQAEEAQGQEAQAEEAQIEEALPDETAVWEESLPMARDGQVEWRIGEQPSVSESSFVQETAVQETEAQETEIQETTAQESGTPPADREETAQQAIARPETYVVKKGDSLAQIARKFYGDTSRLNEICELNEIEDPDQIRPGQNILLP